MCLQVIVWHFLKTWYFVCPFHPKKGFNECLVKDNNDTIMIEFLNWLKYKLNTSLMFLGHDISTRQMNWQMIEHYTIPRHN